MKIKTLEICGVKELVASLCPNPDSVAMHIEDPETLETAPYSFVLGKNDLQTVMVRAYEYKDERDVLNPLGMITAYGLATAATLPELYNLVLAIGYACTPSIIASGPDKTYIRATYYDLVQIKKSVMDNGSLRFRPGMTALLDWIDSLPYQELLTVDEEED